MIRSKSRHVRSFIADNEYVAYLSEGAHWHTFEQEWLLVLWLCSMVVAGGGVVEVTGGCMGDKE